MKNIHVLPTDKKSSLYLGNLGKPVTIKSASAQLKKRLCLCITSDEEIKEGDYTLMYDDFGYLFLCDKPQQYLGIEKGHHLNKGLKKIILTTDQELIKDGVQSIDDEFLEWFIKNPSCESVETHIVKLCTNCGQQFCDNRDCRGYKDEPEYLISFPENTIKQIITYCKGYEISRENIIIPKEKPNYNMKQEILAEMEKQETPKTFKELFANTGIKPTTDESGNIHYNFKATIKQETLEEKLDKIVSKEPSKFWEESDERFKLKETLEEARKYAELSYYGDEVDVFVNGAKWQQERSYSEDNLKEAYSMGKSDMSIRAFNERFKKK